MALIFCRTVYNIDKLHHYVLRIIDYHDMNTKNLRVFIYTAEKNGNKRVLLQNVIFTDYIGLNTIS